MYCLVLYQLKPIQQGIQAQHAITEYAENHFNNPDYRQWASQDKTTIVLSVGGSNELTDALLQLRENKIIYKLFQEEDLYNQPTAMCFLVDERVWDKKKYPDPIYHNNYPPINKEVIDVDLLKLVGNEKNVFLRSFLSNYKLA